MAAYAVRIAGTCTYMMRWTSPWAPSLGANQSPAASPTARRPRVAVPRNRRGTSSGLQDELEGQETGRHKDHVEAEEQLPPAGGGRGGVAGERGLGESDGGDQDGHRQGQEEDGQEQLAGAQLGRHRREEG